MKTCLVIDEFSVVRKIAFRILTLSGYTVHCAQSLEEALGVLESSGAVEIAIVSATLPDCPVDEAIRLLRSHEGGRRAIVLASLVEAQLGLMTRAKRAGAKGFVYRPFDRTSLARWLEPYAASEPMKASA